MSPYGGEPAAAFVDVWNAAAGGAFLLRDRLFRQNGLDDPQFDPAGCAVARTGDDPRVAGFCVAKVARIPVGADGLLRERGWISLLAVRPDAQRRGVGRALVRAAEGFVRRASRPRILLGGDPGHFLPGIPDGSAGIPFFEALGYDVQGEAYDLRRSLTDYRTPPEVEALIARRPDVEIRPVAASEAGALLRFLDRVFPGRWRYTVGRCLEAGGTTADVLGIVQGDAVVGFAQLFHPDSAWLGPSIAWPPPDAGANATGGLGPMGLAPEVRGQGLARALLDRAALRLKHRGLETMIVDWTILLDFYGKLGFAPYRRYRHGERRLAGTSEVP